MAKQPEEPLRDSTWACWYLGGISGNTLHYLKKCCGLPYYQLSPRIHGYLQSELDQWKAQRSKNSDQMQD